ncbi:prolyl 3-hydroxylase OGFOD1 [Cylas formicarius]|uniref:prolyl 3-hydroxylase OGFOD1 n=1 Tax=Cylas formicarius TaxID=197179 RepID=UPI002958B8FA|nr:prolyl 3-hydroxylase OGFOD1 [Cylas formicarius]
MATQLTDFYLNKAHNRTCSVNGYAERAKIIFADCRKMEESDSENDFQRSPMLDDDESESDVDCEVWDKDCRILTHSFPSGSITGFHLMPTCDRESDIQPRKKQRLCPIIRKTFQSAETTESIKKCWLNNSELFNDDIRLIADPFKICILKNFLANPALLDEARQEFNELDFNYRSMDLYEFFQSKDIVYLKQEHLICLYKFLKDDVMRWIAELTGFDLSHVSATCSIYTNSDYLLVHDDQREDRMVAFILYLTGKEGWDKRKGGPLQLFSKDRSGHPQEVVYEMFPENNQFIFFPVTSDSYHQVAEVVTLNDCRLSINGWFHTKTPPVFKTPEFIPSESSIYGQVAVKAKDVDVDLAFWLDDNYVAPEAIRVIQRHIEEHSEISLRHFFKPNLFDNVVKELRKENVAWQKVYPLNRYSYEIADYKTLPKKIIEFIDIFQSRHMFKLLEKYTELELNSIEATMKFELQRWTPGSYSLLNDFDWKEKNELDLIIYFGCKKTSDVIGARTQYVTMEDEIQNALVTVEPQENRLNIVYRDSARLTKYYSRQSRCKCFYSLLCSYSE